MVSVRFNSKPPAARKSRHAVKCTEWTSRSDYLGTQDLDKQLLNKACRDEMMHPIKKKMLMAHTPEVVFCVIDGTETMPVAYNNLWLSVGTTRSLD